MRSAPIPVIVNASAGKGWDAAQVAALEAQFLAAGVEARVLPARSGSELQALAEEAVRESPAMIVAGGGDGTISTVAGVLKSTGIILGVLPLGTLNHFARDLAIPLEVEAAVRVIAAGRTESVDMGQVNERTFINNSSLGIYPDIVRDRERQQRRLGRGKRWALVWASITALRRSPFVSVRLVLDGEARDFRTPFVFIGNNEYRMEGLNIGTRASLRAGQLSVYVTQRRGRLALFALGLRALFGRLEQARDFLAATVQSVEVGTRRRRIAVATDGEVAFMEPPLRYRILPAALEVLVP
jgi:diacylglycerol kinase family enzyme